MVIFFFTQQLCKSDGTENFVVYKQIHKIFFCVV